ncbi:MAG: hypothetical protein LBI43_04860 [Streptococcaceae bacterium]|nr:hypothetical protein [Streptococcaceae bacterium]
MKKTDEIKYIQISSLNFQDKFFDSLKNDYFEFEDWLARKSDKYAYVVFNESQELTAFLLLQEEDGEEIGIVPELTGKRLKISTFKIDESNHSGTSLGKRFLSIALREFAVKSELEKIYVTIFEQKQPTLVRLLNKYGFENIGTKNNVEQVFSKNRIVKEDVYKDYPFIVELKNQRKYLLSIFPKYHNKMFSESEVKTETAQSKSSVYNNIEKVYLSGSSDAKKLKVGDIIIPYRTGDGLGPAYYRSVVSAITTVAEVKNILEFKTERILLIMFVKILFLRTMN